MVNSSQLRFGKEVDKLDLIDISILVEHKIEESYNLEYKQPTRNVKKDCNSIAKQISGFLNSNDGIIIYGVIEKKVNHHSYPSGYKYTNTPKEHLENLLKSRVDPWHEQIKIKRIPNKNEFLEGIFVIEVPKSNTPPHMGNSIYYKRLNFQALPMSHEDVFRAFQISWIRRIDLTKEIIEPIYAEITEEIEKIRKYQPFDDHKYDNIILHHRYLYDQIEDNLRKNITRFYNILSDYNKKIRLMDELVNNVINEELYERIDEAKDWISKNPDYTNIRFKVKWKTLSGSIKNSDEYVSGAMFFFSSLREYLCKKKDMEFISYEVRLGKNKKIKDRTFQNIWNAVFRKISEKDIFTSITNERKTILTLSNEILDTLRIL